MFCRFMYMTKFNFPCWAGFHKAKSSSGGKKTTDRSQHRPKPIVYNITQFTKATLGLLERWQTNAKRDSEENQAYIVWSTPLRNRLWWVWGKTLYSLSYHQEHQNHFTVEADELCNDNCPHHFCCTCKPFIRKPCCLCMLAKQNQQSKVVYGKFLGI